MYFFRLCQIKYTIFEWMQQTYVLDFSKLFFLSITSESYKSLIKKAYQELPEACHQLLLDVVAGVKAQTLFLKLNRF